MLSIEKCRKILHKNGGPEYTDEEILKVRDVLYKLAQISFEVVKKKKMEKSKVSEKNQ